MAWRNLCPQVHFVKPVWCLGVQTCLANQVSGLVSLFFTTLALVYAVYLFTFLYSKHKIYEVYLFTFIH